MAFERWLALLRKRRREKHNSAKTRQTRMTVDTMARVLDEAFEAWAAGAYQMDGLRSTPRVAVDGLPPLPVTGYAYAGGLVELHEEARVVDVSAGGIRIAMSQAMPVGAIAYFALSGDRGEVHYGTAAVARCDATSDGFDLGLRFAEDAESIDISKEKPTRRVRSGDLPRWLYIVRKARECLNHVIGILSNQVPSSVLLTESHQGNRASFLVTAKLFRYEAALQVNGRKVACKRGPLYDRTYNFVSSRARPTILNLSGDGFSAWATLRPNGVTAFSLEPMVKMSCGGDDPSSENKGLSTSPNDCRREVNSAAVRRRERAAAQ